MFYIVVGEPFVEFGFAIWLSSAQVLATYSLVEELEMRDAVGDHFVHVVRLVPQHLESLIERESSNTKTGYWVRWVEV